MIRYVLYGQFAPVRCLPVPLGVSKSGVSCCTVTLCRFRVSALKLGAVLSSNRLLENAIDDASYLES